jgi:eukaryotic-like serine/threonine-protein kinase
VRKILRSSLKTLSMMHDEGRVCHRDLKPDNIFVADDLNITIIDFNVAKVIDEPITGSTGLKHWSAPEMRRNLSYDEKCDVFSLGLVAAYMLSSGQVPNKSLSYEEN